MGTSCEHCEKGKWKTSIGVTSCSRCEDTLKGSITEKPGSTSSSSCICPPRTYDDGKGSCVPIEEGMREDLSGMTLASLTLEEGLWRTKKGVNKCQKMGSGRCARMVHNGAQAFFPGKKGRDGAQIDKMPFGVLRNSLSACKKMFHERNLRPDSILKSRPHVLFQNGPCLRKIVPDFFS